MIDRINQDDGGQLLKIVEGEDGGYAGVNEMLKCLLETFEPEKEFADEIAGDEKKSVAEGQEVWEAATATCGVTSTGVNPMLATFMVTVETTLTAATSMLAARRAVIAKETTTTETTEIGDNSRLDREIESIRRLMMKVSQRQQTIARKQKNLSKRKNNR